MTPTGIVRRIDGIGRVGIPKEFRRKLGIHEGDAMEIYIDGDFVCFRKFEDEEQEDEA